jgi:hypothetical protein
MKRSVVGKKYVVMHDGKAKKCGVARVECLGWGGGSNECKATNELGPGACFPRKISNGFLRLGNYISHILIRVFKSK